MLKKVLAVIFLIFLPTLIFSEEIQKEVVLNRLFSVNIPVETQSPILNKPVFLIPPGVKLLESYLKTTFADKYRSELELLIYCERAGSYNIGPFVFIDKDGNSHTSPPIKITTTEREGLNLPENNQRSENGALKFYTMKPHETLFTKGYVYFVIEVPLSYKSIEIIWSGWENVYTQQVPEIKQKKDHYEVTFIVFFNKDGKYHLSPIKLKVKKGQNEQIFSSASLDFEVKKMPEELNVLGLGEGVIKPAVYTTTHKNNVLIDLSYTGTGNLYDIRMPEIDVVPEGTLLLKRREIEFYEYYPEIKGNVKSSFIFLPPQDNTYQIKIEGFKLFNPKTAVFKNTSGFFSTINVMLPSNPENSEYKETLKEKLNIKSKPDYDFYAIIIGLLFVTFLSVGLYFRTLKRSKKPKRRPTKFSNDNFLIVQRAILVYLKFFTGQEPIALPLSQIKERVRKSSSMSDELKAEIISWLEEAFKVRYLKKGWSSKEELLRQQGVELLRKMKKERQKNITKIEEEKNAR